MALQDQEGLHLFTTKVQGGNQTRRCKYSNTGEIACLFSTERDPEQLPLISCCLHFCLTTVWGKKLNLFPECDPAVDILSHHQSWWRTIHSSLIPLEIFFCFCFVKEVAPFPLLSQTCWYRLGSSQRENSTVRIQYMDKTPSFTLLVMVESQGTRCTQLIPSGLPYPDDVSIFTVP